MNIIVKLNGQDITEACLMSATKITADSSKRITTASISIMAGAMGSFGEASLYDTAQYDRDVYSLTLSDLLEVEILDGRDGVTKLFDGQITSLTLQQSDAPGFSVFYQCDMTDWAAYLDRAVCWDSSFAVTMPNSDQGIIEALLGKFCPKIALASIASIVPVVQKYDWTTKTCRQVLDDMSTLSMGSWRVDFDGKLYYYLASSAPDAPFGLSTSPDYITTFPVRVDGYKQDFTNPINHAYVRGGQDTTTAVAITADYADPVSIQTYGEYAAGVVDNSIISGWDAALRAKSMVLTYAYPIETGNFTIWGKDGLACGMQVHLREDNLGIDGDYTIIQLAMQWVDADTVQYTAQFGAAQPDLETILRLLNQRTMWATSNPPISMSGGGPPPPGSVTDASIAVPPGLSASSIQSVNASTIQGFINAGQIGSVNASAVIGQLTAGQIGAVNAGSIVGVISATQIGSVNASTIQGQIQATQIAGVNATAISGSITAAQIGSVNATTINGVIVSSQLADQIIDTLSKYATALTPIQMVKTGDPWPVTMPNKNFPPNSFFYYQPDGNFYKVNAAGTGWAVNNSPSASLMSFYYIGAINATSITGLILAAQIGSVNASAITGTVQAAQIGTITAGQITGQITAAQIGGVNASVIVGGITAPQISTVNATAIQGSITATQIASVTAAQITGTLSAAQIGTITSTQIGSINAATITIGLLQDAQIAGMSGAKLAIGTVDSTKFNGFSIDVGGGTNLPGRIRVLNGGTTIAQMGVLTEVGLAAYGGWFQVWGAGGTSYSNAPIYTDTGGALHISAPSITGATLTNSTITNPAINVSGQITTSTATFDATYSSLALINANPPDSCSFISRGLVFYYNGSKIGALVRSPSGGWMAMEFLGAAYILLDASHGIRSDQGYYVSSTQCINSSAQWIAGISTTASIFTSSTCQASGGFLGGTFQGSDVNVSGGALRGGSVNIGGGQVACGSVDTGTGSVTCGTLTINGVGGQAVICPNSQMSAKAFGIYQVGNGVTGSFTSANGKTVTVNGGIITSIA